MEMNLLSFIPEKIGDKTINVERLDNKIFVYAKGRVSIKRLNLNTTITFDDFFFEVIGLYYGDGLNTRAHTGNRRTAFANSNYILHLHWLSFLKSVGLEKEELFGQISIDKDNIRNNVLDYWHNHTGIPKENFSKISFCKKRCSGYGVLSLEFNSILFRKIFDKIFDYSLSELNSNERYIKAFIRGLFAAEGSVIPRNNSIVNLSIAIKDSSRREFVKGLLRKIGFKISCLNNNTKEIVIHGYMNFKLFRDLNLSSIHPAKNELFIKLFGNMGNHIPNLTKSNILQVLKSRPMTRHNIAISLNRDISIIHKILRLLENEGKIFRIGKEKSFRKSKDIWSLTKP